MNRSILSLLIIGGLIFSTAITGQTVRAQVIWLPAEMNKSFSPLSIPSGGISRLTVNIYNPNAFELTGASWTDNLTGVQPGLTIANPAGVTNSCGGTVTAVAGSTSLSLTGGRVPAQSGVTPGTCSVSINVTASATGNLINTIPAGALESTGEGTNISNTTPASATLNVIAPQTPSISKSFNSSTIWAGETSQLTITIANNHPSTTLTQASLVDNLPANVFLANPVSPTLTGCGPSASLAAVAGTTSVTLNNGSIAPSSTCIIRVNVTSNIQGTYTNRIPVGALQTEQGLTNGTSASTRLTVRAIGITKRFSPSTISPGNTTTLTITLQNPRSTPYTGVNVTDTLPSPLIVNGTATSTCVPPGTVSTTSNSVSLTGGTIPAGSPGTPGTCTISVPITVPAGTPSGTLTNTIPPATLTTAEGIGNLSSATATVNVSGTDMTAIKSFSPSTIPAGGNARLRIDIFAPGDTNLTNFGFIDDLPAGMTVSNSTAPATSGCGPTPPLVLDAATGADSISISNGRILAGQRCRIEVYVTSATPRVYINTIPPASFTNTEGRLPVGNVSSTLTVSGSSDFAIALVKGFDPLTVFGGSASRMSIQLINPGSVALTGIGFTDDMPDGMILANPVNFDVGTCGGSLTGTPGDGSFSFSGGNLPPLGSCTLTLNATMTVNGNLTNTIPEGAVITANGTITNVDPAAASLTNLPGASVSKFFSPNPAPAGSSSLLTITIQNTGGVSLTGLGLRDELPGSLPAGLAVAASPAPVNNCGGTLSAVAGSQIIELTNGVLAANAACTMVVSVIGNVAGSFTNTIPPGRLSSNENATNLSTAADTLVITGNASVSGGGTGRGRGNSGNGNTTSTSTAGASFLIPVTGFAPNVITPRDGATRPAYDATGLRMQIPVLKIDTSIVGVELKNGGWDVSWLQGQAGWLNGTAYPTWNGNSVLTAHVVNADGKPGLFSKLKYLDLGEYIYVYNAGYRYTYKVVSNELVQSNDMNALKHEDKAYLTLITCDTYDESSNTYLKRVIIRAQLVDVRSAPR